MLCNFLLINKLRLASACAFLVLAALNCTAQTDLQKRIQELAKVEPDYALTKGVFGNLFSGFTYGFYNTLQKDLQGENLLGGDDVVFSPSGQGTVLGGQLGGIVGGKVIVTLNAARQSFNEQTSVRGSARLSNVGFGFSVGYAVYNKNQVLIYPYLGYHFGQATLSISNYHTDTVFYGSAPILRGQRGDYKANSGYIEIGAGARYLMSRHGGLMIGADAGIYLTAGGGAWQPIGPRETPTGVSASAFQGVYARITIGGGLFYAAEYIKRRKRGSFDEPTEGGLIQGIEEGKQELPPEKPKLRAGQSEEEVDSVVTKSGRKKPAKVTKEEAIRGAETSPFAPAKKGYKAPKPVKPQRAKPTPKKKTDYDESEFEKN